MSNNNTNTQETTFWNFLKTNTIEIPIIQRDYAQGRLGKEYLRKSFLTDIKNALDNKKEMKLDFVYGSVENGKLSPLDGQQRLTTLWLLHWYIALMSGKLNEEVCKTLARFTYETRISSREFCKNLCKPEHFKDYQGYVPTKGDRKIVEYITSRTWFYSAWKQDPTIQSMLRMLGGTEINDKKGEDIVDGLEEIFKDTSDFGKYWECLESKKAPVAFYQLPLKDFGLSDDLYIKMNARGKQLTSFENFKADLVGYIVAQSKSELLRENDKEEWDKLLDAKEGIPIKMDTTWTDIFWKNKSQDNKIDEIYFAFLNRFFLCELICQKEEKEGKEDFRLTADDLEKKNDSFSYLYGNKGDDTDTVYEGDFVKYKYDHQENKENRNVPKCLFDVLSKVLDRCSKTNFRDCFPEWVKSDFQFIPKYKEDNKITTLTQSERVVFHAISKYLQIDDFEKESFKQWMRVVWNIVENANINSIATMIGAMRLIDELGEHSHTIYEFLACKSSNIKSEAAKDQVAEEIAKAQQILNGAPRSDGESWEKTIIDAEKTAFFNGAIRFLFQNENGEVSEDSWNSFDTKFDNAKKYFEGETPLYKIEKQLLKTLISYFDSWENFINIHYDNESWDKKLLNPKLTKSIHNLLMNSNLCDFDSYESTLNEEKKIQEQLVKSKLLDRLDKNGYYMESGHNLHKYYSNRTGDIYLGRNRKLLQSESIEVHKDNGCICDDIFYGLNIQFKYDNQFFRWYGAPNDKELDIYMMKPDWTDYLKRSKPIYNKKNTDEDEWYCFRVDNNTTENSFLKNLDSLINEAKNNGDIQKDTNQ